MSIHPLFPATRPARMPLLMPLSLDGLLSRRREAGLMASYIVHQTRLPYRLAARQCDFETRLNARIAELTA